MPTERGEKVKLYVVIGLVCAAAVVAYFRFIHKGADIATDTASPPAEEVSFDLTEIEKARTKSPRLPRFPADESLSLYIRDIFTPVQLPTASEALVQAGQTSGSTDILKLKGTILSGKIPMAIINDRFVQMGEKIGEYQIVRIDPNEVLLRSASQEKILQVLAPGHLQIDR
jgi:hypothetical protein